MTQRKITKAQLGDVAPLLSRISRELGVGEDEVLAEVERMTDTASLDTLARLERKQIKSKPRHLVPVPN